MVHAALLLLMLEAVDTDLVFTISLKRSTQNLQLSTNSPADYPIFCLDSNEIVDIAGQFGPLAVVRARSISVSKTSHLQIDELLCARDRKPIPCNEDGSVSSGQLTESVQQNDRSLE
jgi:hypothetical protein